MANFQQVVPFVAASNYFFINDASLANPATDVFTLRGSATRTVIVQGVKVVLSVPNDSSPAENLFLVRRSSVGTGGVQTAPFNAFGLSQSTATATATAFGWLTSPTVLGTFVGNIDMSPTASLAAVSPQDPHDAATLLTVPFTVAGAPSGITLPTVNDCVSVNLGEVGRALPAGGMPMFVAVYWSEVIT